MYDNENLYVIFRVKERFIRCTEQNYNEPVDEESSVEIFFSPDPAFRERYFNL